MRKYICIFFLGLSVIFSRCKIENRGIVIPNKPYEKLSEYNFYQGALSELNPSARVLPYDLNSPLFSDYAKKIRFVWMPEGSSAKYKTDHILDFPIGTVLIKNFLYYHDNTDLSKGRRIMETRILVHAKEEWNAYSYIWNDEQTDATYEVIGDIKDVSWINHKGEKQNVEYIIPNKNQCKGCHSYKNQLLPIGPKVRNLNKDFAYSDGVMNQLDKWTSLGYLTGFGNVRNSPRVAVWDDSNRYGLHERAMAYLDINCGHCHNPDGAANTSGLTLLADSELNTALGIFKATVSAGSGTGGHTYSIVPGNPDESVLVYRMKSNNPGAMMPELGRRLVHEEGVALIEDWIRNMNLEDIENPKLQSLK